LGDKIQFARTHYLTSNKYECVIPDYETHAPGIVLRVRVGKQDFIPKYLNLLWNSPILQFNDCQGLFIWR